MVKREERRRGGGGDLIPELNHFRNEGSKYTDVGAMAFVGM